MKPETAAAKMGARVARLEPGISGARQDILSAEDIAYGLGLVSKQKPVKTIQWRRLNHDAISALIWVKWAHEDRFVLPLLFEVQRAIYRRSAVKRMRVARGTLERMAVMALIESGAIHAAGRYSTGAPEYKAGRAVCPQCDGTKERFSKRYKKWFACGECNGSGDIVWNEKRRARRCMMRTNIWVDHGYSILYLAALALISRWEREGLRAIRRHSLMGRT